MRALKEKELEQVSGGNPLGAAYLSLASAYYAGTEFGNSINEFNSYYSGMSLGEAIYRTFNTSNH